MKRMLFYGMLFLVGACQALRPVTVEDRPYEKPLVDKSLRYKIVEDGKSCIGSPYKYAGKDRRGFDCSGFTSYVMKQNGITISSSSKTQATNGRKIAVSQVEPGDLIFFGNSGKVSHVALVVSNTKEGIKVVHSTSSKGVILQNISTSNYWKPRILFARSVI
ncbi:MAG: C40 family peptidase [Bacteroidota bacterium]